MSTPSASKPSAGKSAAAKPASNTADIQETVVLTANELRALAEEVDGLRNADAVIVRNPDRTSPRRYRVVRADQTRSGDTPVMHVRTDDDPSFAKREPAFALHSTPAVMLANHQGLTLAHCDAVFTSLSAFDKFVLPYYAQMRKLEDVKMAREKFATTPTALAVVHLPQSDPDTLVAAGSLYAMVAREAPVAEAVAPAALRRAAGPPAVELQGLVDGFINR